MFFTENVVGGNYLLQITMQQRFALYKPGAYHLFYVVKWALYLKRNAKKSGPLALRKLMINAVHYVPVVLIVTYGSTRPSG